MKKLKGGFDSGTTYAVDDVVIYEGSVYWLQKPCAAGTKPIETLFWGKLGQEASEIVIMLSDTIAELMGAIAGIPKNIDDESILLKSGDNEYLITVDDSGEEPELTVTLVEEEGD